MRRLEINAHDIVLITGKTARNGRYVLAKLRVILNKKPYQIITIEEFCDYYGLELAKVLDFLKLP